MDWLIIIAFIILIGLLNNAFRSSIKYSAVQNAFLAKYTYEQLSYDQKNW